mgnify:CR=1 FL=1
MRILHQNSTKTPKTSNYKKLKITQISSHKVIQTSQNVQNPSKKNTKDEN